MTQGNILNDSVDGVRRGGSQNHQAIDDKVPELEHPLELGLITESFQRRWGCGFRHFQCDLIANFSTYDWNFPTPSSCLRLVILPVEFGVPKRQVVRFRVLVS